jgi:hypothetical protein
MKTRLRTGNAREESKREALELHSMELEKAFIFGQPYQTTGTNGQPMNATGGLISFLGQDPSFSNITDFGATPVTINTFETLLESAFRYGSAEKLLLAGSTAINVINGMVKKASVMNVVPGGESYGMKLTEYICPFGTLYIKVHPLFSIHPTYRSWGLFVDLDKLVFRYIDDTDFRPNVQANDIDGEKDEFLTEAGMECQHQKAHALAKNMTSFTPS